MKNYEDWYKIWEKRDITKPKVVWMPFSWWFDKKFNFKEQMVLDFGSSKETKFYKKFKKDNAGYIKKYRGYDTDKTAIVWLRENNFYYDFWNDDSLKEKFNLIYCSHVYEHLDMIQREKFIERSHELLAENGILLIDIPHIANLNIIEFFRVDRTHKPVSREVEALYIELFGFESEIYLVGLTMPYISPFTNIWNIIRNIFLGFYPQWLTIIIAKKKKI